MKTFYEHLRSAMSSRINFIFLLYSIILWSCCLAQTPVFHFFDIQSGLAQNTVLSITQDARGFLWFGTPEGLSRYDSRSFKTYTNDPTNPTSISYNRISSSLSDTHHTLWIGTFKGLNKYKPESDSFQRYFHDPENKKSLSNDRIFCLYEDRKGTKWIGTDNGLNRLVNDNLNKFERYLYSEIKPTAPNQAMIRINGICEDQQGNLWLATNTGLIRMTFTKTGIGYKTFTHQANKSNSLIENSVSAVICDQHNKLWIGTKSGKIDSYDPVNESFIHWPNLTPGLSTYNEINCMQLDKQGRIWIGTLQGAIRLNPISMEVTEYQNDPRNSQSLSDNSIFVIFEDNQQSIWLGTYISGVNVLYPTFTPFKTIEQSKPARGITHRAVSSIREDQRQNFWININSTSLDYVNLQTGLLANYRVDNRFRRYLPSKLIKTVFVDKSGYTWVGTQRGDLSRISPNHRQWMLYPTNHQDSASGNENTMRAILEDSQQRFWVTFGREIDLFDQEKGSLRRYHRFTNQVALSDILLEDSHKNIWIGGKGGMCLLKDKSTRFCWIPFTINVRAGDAPEWVNCMHEDRYGRLWLGTSYGGLKLYDAKKNTFVDYNFTSDLSRTRITSIESDAANSLWLGTYRGLIRFNVGTKRSQQYTRSDGLAGSEIMPNASYRATNGELYFGTNKGLVYFNPADIKLNQYPPPVVFTGLEVANKAVSINDKTHLLNLDISQTDQIRFSYQQNFFTLTFAVLNYIKPEKNQYAYKLEGLDQEWHSIKAPSITYNNLPYGTYTLLVNGANNDGIWNPNPTKLSLVILPPWWKSWWAYSLYGILAVVVLSVILRYYWLRGRIKQEHLLNQAKLDFFTNISHEIRTNLTLITGPIDRLLSLEKDNPELQKHLTYAKSNSDRLLTLVTELLDFRKAESNELQLYVSQNKVTSFLKNSITSFQHLAEKRNVNLIFSAKPEHLVLWFDPNQLAKVIYNLLSNAFKFMSDGGTIEISVKETEHWVAITVSDTGRGVSEETIKKLFTNYFQGYNQGETNTGYGIGLALSRRIAELHGGTLTVESQEARNGNNGFTCFTLALRKGHHHFTREQLVDSIPLLPTAEFSSEVSVKTQEAIERAESGQHHTILLVDDNDELRSFIRDVLINTYHIIEAINGQVGWEAACQHIPDLVISDIMMADMDGLALLRKLKTDVRTNHIPVVLLTAKAAVAHQIEGLETGADSYLIKPLNLPLLELCLRNHFTAREIMRQKYSRLITLEPQHLTINTVQEEFIVKLVQIIEENLFEKGFVAEKLAAQVNMSKPVLYKKLKAITDMSVNDFIKSIRMKKAAKLLQQSNLNINEVAMAVGFDDRRYFSREFKKFFGLYPSEYMK
ncbi:hybrid sensor histidine kinase/response regulator transcription factor [Spirosoma validum]|uniref:histidine kinase n=1 Tax=Spirosoma validum TaxID=2771355 RepID=A0A927GF43_9BACT|nr:hybrid sensor histidine kinase/response regulator transcription factor [Spirosoma validum]MBD2755260.1 helix-turn-helix domain-containing protein [Spirosoma validum]